MINHSFRQEVRRQLKYLDSFVNYFSILSGKDRIIKLLVDCEYGIFVQFFIGMIINKSSHCSHYWSTQWVAPIRRQVRSVATTVTTTVETTTPWCHDSRSKYYVGRQTDAKCKEDEDRRVKMRPSCMAMTVVVWRWSSRCRSNRNNVQTTTKSEEANDVSDVLTASGSVHIP